MNYTEAEFKTILTDYAKAQAARSADEIEEELFEMRAAFGEGEKIINVFTGEITYT